MTTTQTNLAPEVPIAPLPLDVPGAHLFNPDEWLKGDRCLPFVSLSSDAMWLEPEFADGQQADDWGRRGAAAYLIYLMRVGTDVASLSEIIEDMPREGTVAARGFLSYLNHALWRYGQHYSVAQIANDVEAEIAESHRIDAEDLASREERGRVD